ncbi:MAG: LLM class flavin-dependent oxidoreductase [Deltaproteobacteria bacterium]|nr:LLM class flavin-dependent oxidoreductase [Deltaproteobacteria bacterium]
MQMGILSLGDHLRDVVLGERTSQRAKIRAMVELGVRTEKLGLDAFWVGEHHFNDYIVSSPQLVLAAVAERTSRIRLGTGVTLLPNHDPVRVAEDFATLDILSEGRVDLGVGRGIFSDIFEAFGQDYADSRAQYRENLALLMRLWREDEVSWSGRFRTPLTNIRPEPRPVQVPHPPIWIGGGISPESVDLAADLGLPLILPSVFAPTDFFVPVVDRYRERFVAAGHDAAAMCVGGVNHCFVGTSSETARELWLPRYRHYWEWVARLLTDQGTIGGQPSFDIEELERGPAVFGSAEEVAERIGNVTQKLGLDLHLAYMDLGGLPDSLLAESLDAYALEVVPKVRGA